ncbi:DNA repair protein RadA [Gammaproteobacteria bacterium]|nr:DNA repair protein RadA [Gammaproteobacteria bacterium]
MKKEFYCQSCDYVSRKWSGQCPSCQEWNTLEERVLSQKKSSHYAGLDQQSAIKIADVKAQTITRLATNHSEFDRVLGGGIVPGSVVLLGGDPGIGKSTLLLDVLIDFAKMHSALYVTGEESLEQVALRADMIGKSASKAQVLSSTRMDHILDVVKKGQPKLIVIDSIQTMSSDEISAAAGSVSQVRQVTAMLVGYAKQNQCGILIVGHMTKDGQIAGPKVLEHMVDTVLYFEGDSNERYRIIRCAKNRFGPAHEIGVFAMTDTGVKSISNPSKIFLHASTPHSGSVIGAVWNGSRPLLVEIQALVTRAYSDYPKRMAVGYDQTRLNLLIAILQKHANINLSSEDVYVNVVGGIKVNETAADLAVIAAIYSSYRHISIPTHCAFFGEVGLTGEVRAVLNGQPRVNELLKQGIEKIFMPEKNAPRDMENNFISITSVKNLGSEIDINMKNKAKV